MLLLIYNSYWNIYLFIYLLYRLVLMEKSDMERQVLKLRTDLDTSDKELKEKTVQLSQLRKRMYNILNTCVY